MKSNPAVLEIIAGLSLESPLGGIERFAFDLSRQLKKQDFPVTIYGLWGFGTKYENTWQEYLSGEGIRTIIGENWRPASPYRSFIKSLTRMIRDLEKYQFGIVHSHDQFGDIIALFLKKRLGARMVIRTVHTEIEWEKRPLRRIGLTNLIYPLAYDFEIGVSESIVNHLNKRRISRLFGKNALWIQNAVDLTRFNQLEKSKDELRQQFGISTDAPVLGSIGRLTEQKGYEYAIKAIANVVQSIPQIVFILFGKGELEDALKSLSEQLGISKHVIFAGSRANIESFFPVMDLFISSSLWEGLPTVILESMASNVPIIGTDIPGTRELIVDKFNGWLVPARDPQALSSSIIHAMADVDSRRKLVLRAQSTVQNYSIEKISDQYSDLFTKSI